MQQAALQISDRMSGETKPTENVLKELLPTSMPFERVRKFARRTRDYMKMYRDLEIKVQNGEVSREDLSYDGLEKMRKVFKSHRNIMELEGVYLMNVV